MSFAVGTKVRLNSDGPTMTVKALDGESVTCVWFDKATLREATFSIEMLEEPARLDELLEALKRGQGDTSPGA